ncbi:MAG TPA: DUF6049 family protein [Nocardioidaceae bacterium]|nr:DUF6049 family protein [Nocardioidaceae bacterium]
MNRPRLARLAACLGTALMAVGLVPVTAGSSAAAAVTARAAPATPLAVSVESMSPSVIPRKGTITVTGEVTNRSESTWTDLKVYLLTSSEPFTSTDELEEASASDPVTEIGSRLYLDGQYDEVGDLAPGDSTGFTLTLPRDELKVSGAPGVYWLGVHVLGALDGVRDNVADGRARTFVPLMDPRGPRTALSLVVPVKATVKRQPDGTLANLKTWHKLLDDDGRLGRLLQLSGTSPGLAITWVLDPAVLDAVRSVARDNPPMDSGPTDTDDEANTPPSTGGSPSAGPSADEESTDPSDTASDDTTGDTTGDASEEPPTLSEEAGVAADWLSTFRSQSAQHTVLSTPYGDVDAAAMLRGDFAESYEQATELSATTMEDLGIQAGPVLAPPPGFLPSAALSQVDPETPVILADQAAPEAEAPVVRTELGHRVVLTDTSAGEGGPGPTSRLRALALRQRILSEAAVHALSAERDQPLVVSTPQSWNPGSDWQTADFFAGLDVPWLRAVDVPTAALSSSDETFDGQLSYPARQRRAELPVANLLATQELARIGNTYADLLTRNDTVDEQLAKSAMLGSSYRVRRRPQPAAARVRETTQTIRSRMGQITIDGPSFVTMSSEDGPIGVTIVNGLSEPVTVGVRASVSDNGSDELVIHPAEPVSIGPGQRASVRLRATAKDIGVHSVTLVPTSPNGDPLGSTTKFNVRSSQVGLVIWVIMGIGAAVLLIASGVRIVRSIRTRKATHGPRLEDADR